MIYLIDDNPRCNIPEDVGFDSLLSEVYSEYFRVYDHFDSDQWPFLDDENAVIFIHESFHQNNFKFQILEYIDSNAIPSIRFSGSYFKNKYEPADSYYGECWLEMVKNHFYRHLPRYVERYRKTGEMRLDDFLEDYSIDLQDDTGVEDPADLDNIDRVFCLDYNCPAAPQDIRELIDNNIKGKRIIEFDLDKLEPEIVRYAGAYIRLSPDTLKDSCLSPFIFKGEKSYEEYIKAYQDRACCDVLIWPASYFRNINDIDKYDTFKPLTMDEYVNSFIKNLKINPNEIVGNHSISNYWGAFIMGSHISGFDSDRLFSVALDKDALYLKYLLACRRSVKDLKKSINGEMSHVNEYVDPVDDKIKPKVLLIDDQDDIWAAVIRALIPGATLTVIGKTNNLINTDADNNFLTQEAQEIIEKSEDYDLILLDLRLGGIEEESVVNGDNCSGMKVLGKIIYRNAGQQVIMFTSSNKAWNLRKALTMAAGYYIKESPMQPFSEDETIRNINAFLDTIESCIRYKDLRKVIQNILTLDRYKFYENYQNADIASRELKYQLYIVKDMAISQCHMYDSEDESWTYVYIALFQILEIIKCLSSNYSNKDKGNTKNNPKQFLANLIKDVCKDFLDKEGLEKHMNLLRAHIDLRNDLIHVQNSSKGATYEDFLALWDLIYKMLTELKNR